MEQNTVLLLIGILLLIYDAIILTKAIRNIKIKIVIVDENALGGHEDDWKEYSKVKYLKVRPGYINSVKVI